MTDRVFPASKPPTATNGVPPAPPPAPSAVNGNGTANGTANQKPQVYIPANRPVYRPQPYSRHHHHRSRPSCRRVCCCCCFWSILIFLLLALMAAIAATAVYVIYRPRPPSFSVPSIRISRVNLTTASDTSVSHLSSFFNFTLLSENPNGHLTFSYDPFAVTVKSAKSGETVANGTVPAFFSGNKNKTTFRGVIATSTSARELDPEEARHLKSDLARARVGLEIEMRTKVKMQMGKVKSEGVEIRVTCQGFEGTVPKGKTPTVATSKRTKYMELELPKRLYGEGLEPQVKKINNSCRQGLVEKLRTQLNPEFEEVKKDPLFSHIMVMEENNLKFSARLVHSFLCKELVTSKRHEKWFTFARRPLRFGLQEYHAVTGLKVNQEKNSRFVKWKDDDGFWSTQIKTSGKISLQSIKKKYLEESSTWTWVDRVRLVYLCVIMGVVFGRDEKVNIPLLYMKLVMDLDKLRNYPWGLHSFNFLLKQINKTRDKLEQTEGYLMEGFLFGFQIWIMEAIPALGEICGTKISDKFTGPRCGNWTGCARCSYQDIINVETLFPENGILHSFMEFHGNGVVLLPTDFAVKDEKKDERVDRILDMIQRKHDWSNHVWGVEKVTSSGFEESDEEEGEEGQEGEEQAADTEIGESSHVAENVNITADVSGKNKRKHADRGAESRKKKVLCQLAASSKGNIDTDMKKFLEGLVEASFMTFEEKFSNIFDKFETVVSDRLGKIETEVTRLRTSSDRSDKFETVVIDRLGNIEAEVTQLRTTLLVTELAEKTDQPSGPSKSKIDTSPSTSKKDTVPSKKKAVKKKELKSSQSSAIVNLPPVNLSQSSAIDLRLGTQDFLESCMKNLSQDTFVKGFDPSQVKAEDSLDWLEPPTSLKMSPRRFTDRDIELAGADEPDSCLAYVCKEDFEKMQNWQDTRTSIQIGPSVLDENLAARVIGPTKWLQNNEIDAVMYVFRERTTLQRWKVDRVAFMTCVFSDLIATDYKHFLDGIKNYKMDPLLLEYGKGELPSHGRTRKLWNVDVDRMYVPVWVNRNHWIALCISFVTRNIQVFDCSGRKSIKEVEAFTKLIPRIVKAVQSSTIRKHLAVTPYSVSIVPMSDLNQLNCHCGVYMLKHIECHVLGLDISLVNDDNIRGARLKTMWDLWEAATDPEFIERMSKYEPPKCKPAECIEL